MEIAESIYIGAEETYYKKLLGQIPSVLFTAGYRYYNQLRQIFNPIQVSDLAIAEKYM